MILEDWIKEKLEQFKDDPEFIKESELLELENRLVKFGAEQERERIINVIYSMSDESDLISWKNDCKRIAEKIK